MPDRVAERAQIAEHADASRRALEASSEGCKTPGRKGRAPSSHAWEGPKSRRSASASSSPMSDRPTHFMCARHAEDLGPVSSRPPLLAMVPAPAESSGIPAPTRYQSHVRRTKRGPRNSRWDVYEPGWPLVGHVGSLTLMAVVPNATVCPWRTANSSSARGQELPTALVPDGSRRARARPGQIWAGIRSAQASDAHGRDRSRRSGSFWKPADV